MRIINGDPITYHKEDGSVRWINPVVFVKDFRLPILMFAIMPPIQAAFIEKKEVFYDFADPAVFLGLKPAPTEPPTMSITKKAIYKLESVNDEGTSLYRFVRIE